ncbi:hypothetical protein SHL15_8430 [Streptomyces hygroscopicus subsp. limoneus]|nr:hypothetical protein SHL15_8430 [Streptomyces hygroscopicus subsp. limoneus]
MSPSQAACGAQTHRARRDVHGAEGDGEEIQHLAFGPGAPEASGLAARGAVAVALLDREAEARESHRDTAPPPHSVVAAGPAGHDTAFSDTYGPCTVRRRCAPGAVQVSDHYANGKVTDVLTAPAADATRWQRPSPGKDTHPGVHSCDRFRVFTVGCDGLCNTPEIFFRVRPGHEINRLKHGKAAGPG